jgi:type II secretory pathway pseudopilin PulG
MNPETALDTITYAANQSDRWIFVALLVVGILAAIVVFRYLTSRLDRVEKKMDQVQGEFNTHLRTANKEMLEVLSVSNQTIGRNMTILDRIERKLETL